MEYKFKFGDKVEFMGNLGVVVLEKSLLSPDKTPISVLFEKNPGIFYYFTREGRFEDWHCMPALKLVESGKKGK